MAILTRASTQTEAYFLDITELKNEDPEGLGDHEIILLTAAEVQKLKAILVALL